MDIKKYIATGILELYVLDMLADTEKKEVERYLVQYPELREEVTKIERALEIYSEGHKLKADPNLEQNILKRLDGVAQEDLSDRLHKKGERSGILVGLLGLLLLFALAGLFWLFYQKNRLENNLTYQSIQLQQLQADCAEKDSTLNQLRNQIDLLLDTDIKKVDLPGTPNAPQALAVVYYNEKDQKAYFNTGNLPQTPSNRQYQLWALVDGNPVDMGIVRLPADGDTAIIEVPFIENSGAFAVTLELQDGNPAPNLDQIYVYGENS